MSIRCASRKSHSTYWATPSHGVAHSPGGEPIESRCFALGYVDGRVKGLPVEAPNVEPPPRETTYPEIDRTEKRRCLSVFAPSCFRALALCLYLRLLSAALALSI